MTKHALYPFAPHSPSAQLPSQLDRRRLLLAGAGVGTGWLLSACGRSQSPPAQHSATALPPYPAARAPGYGNHGPQPQRRPPLIATASSGPPLEPPPYQATQHCTATADNIEGPFFTPGAPQRLSLVTRATLGTRITIAGRVVTTDCQLLPGARIEFWQADHRGGYDLKGYNFRATVQCDAAGAYRLDTIIPGHYLNGDRYRPAHIHAKLSVPGLRPLTTQLYFQGDRYNQGDPFIHPSLIMGMRDVGASKWSSFDFVLPRA